jgi:hypothetical protein
MVSASSGGVKAVVVGSFRAVSQQVFYEFEGQSKRFA